MSGNVIVDLWDEANGVGSRHNLVSFIDCLLAKNLGLIVASYSLPPRFVQISRFELKNGREFQCISPRNFLYYTTPAPGDPRHTTILTKFDILANKEIGKVYVLPGECRVAADDRSEGIVVYSRSFSSFLPKGVDKDLMDMPGYISLPPSVHAIRDEMFLYGQRFELAHDVLIVHQKDGTLAKYWVTGGQSFVPSFRNVIVSRGEGKLPVMFDRRTHFSEFLPENYCEEYPLFFGAIRLIKRFVTEKREWDIALVLEDGSSIRNVDDIIELYDNRMIILVRNNRSSISLLMQMRD